MVTFKQALFGSAMAAAAVVMAPSAHAEGKSITLASGYLFQDFNDLASDNPVANYSHDFRGPFGTTVNGWVQVGKDDVSNELDVTVSTPSVELGPVSCGAMGAVFWTPPLDNLTILTADLHCSADVFGFTVSALSQWYWEDLEDQRFQFSVGRQFQITDRVGLDVEIGQSRIDSTQASPSFFTIGVPISADNFTVRPFAKTAWGGDDDLNIVGGLQFNW